MTQDWHWTLVCFRRVSNIQGTSWTLNQLHIVQAGVLTGNLKDYYENQFQEQFDDDDYDDDDD